MSLKQIYYKAKGLDSCDYVFCAVCGKVANHFHHLQYKSQLGKDIESNLLPLCSECHNRHHSENIPTTEQLKKLKEL